MAEITREQIEELRGLLTKATKGPWSTHLVDDTTIISPEREVATTCDSSQTEREDGYNIEYEQMEIDAALIVTMRNALPALLDIAEKVIAEPSEPKPTSDLLSRLAEAQREVNARGWYGLDVLLNEAETEIRRLELHLREITYSRDTWRKIAEGRKGSFEVQAVERRAASAAAVGVREAALREAATVCSAYSDWASEKISEGRGEIFGTVGNTADDCAERILALIDQPKGGDADERSSNNARHATSPGVTAGASEIEELADWLDSIKSSYDWDNAANAAALIRRLVSERDNARAECAWLAKLLIRLREALNNIAEGAEDEGDRVYFGSTNDADWLKEIAREVESYAFDRIMRESKWLDYIESSAKANARATAAEAEVARLRNRLDPIVHFAWSSMTADCDEARDHLNNLIAAARAALEGKSDGK